MSQWHEANLEQVCEIITDGTHHSPVNGSTGDFKYITSKNIRPYRLDLSDITYVGAEIHMEIYKRCPPKKGDVLYVKDGVNTGTAAINHLDDPFSMLSSVALIRPKANLLNANYLVHWLMSPEAHRRMMKNMSGTAIRRLILREIKQSRLPLPPLEEQRRIAAILDKASAIRSKRFEAIRLTEELLRAAFLDMFGDPVTNPKGWTQNTLGELVSIVSGQVNPQTQPYIDMPHVGVENIQANTGRIIGVQTPRELRLKSGKYLFEPSYVLYSKIRPYLNKVAIPGFTGICSADIYPLCVNESQIDQKYLIYLLRSNIFLSYAEKHSARTNIPKINRSALLEFILPNPPLELQKEFSKIYRKVHGIEEKLEHGTKSSDNLFNSLLHRAFRGEL